MTATSAGLKKGTEYWVKLFSANERTKSSPTAGPKSSSPSPNRSRTRCSSSKVNTDGADFNATIDPNGGRTWYYWEYGPTDAYGHTRQPKSGCVAKTPRRSNFPNP